MADDSGIVMDPRDNQGNLFTNFFGGVSTATGNAARFAQAASIGAVRGAGGVVGLFWRPAPVDSLITYQLDTELSELVDESKRENGRFSSEFANLSVRLAIFGYLEAGSYWQSAPRPIEGFSVTHPEHQSIGMLLASNKIPALFRGFSPKLIGPEYNRSLSRGKGRVSSGIIKEFETDTDLLVMHDVARETIYIIWQGTQSKVDGLNDVRFFPRFWPYRHQGGEKFYASRGFVRSHEAVINDLTAVVKEMWSTGKYKRIFTTGHSLGGILAHLNAHAMSYIMETELEATGLPLEERLVCYTIGSPKGMGWRLRNDYFKRVPHTYRMRNDEDIVARLPAPNRHHVGIPIIMDELRFIINYDETKGFTSDREKIGELVSDHGTANYLSNLLGLESRIRSTAAQSKALEDVFVSMTQLDQTYEWEVLTPTEKSKSVEIARFIKLPVTPVSLSPANSSRLKEAFGESVTIEVTTYLLYYASKLVETHDFRGGKKDDDGKPLQDVQEVSINIFREAFSELALDEDKEMNMEKIRYRIIFDRIDQDSDGLLTAGEFVRATSAMKGQAFSLETTNEELLEKLRAEFENVYALIEESYPGDPRLELTSVSFAEFFVWAKLTGYALSALQIAL
ncbi:hypothetical protein NDN08_005734 [Rhodosorus marinus]|uniref:EF-hand domain-containing protein n=1 Tax=Rhodosorus marinus TaxID=101924 RepID=A0AAV8V2F2_9RHOD|nr:hypothetical protein NDN08_005734 [Rhodosorus marinus]